MALPCCPKMGLPDRAPASGLSVGPQHRATDAPAPQGGHRGKDGRIGASYAAPSEARATMNRVRRPQDQRGIALVLTLIFSILLYILVAELVVSGRMLRHTGENDARLARMQNQMEYTLNEVYDSLLSDMAGQAAGG